MATTQTSTSVNTFLPGPGKRTVRASGGKVLNVPENWALLPPGDAGLTRRVKAAGDHWVVQEMKRGKRFSHGVWAPALAIEALRAELELERASPSYAKRMAAAAQRREKTQEAYVEDFGSAVLAFLSFHENHARIARQLAIAVSKHATPVGSGTVARTKRIPIERRAQAAVIAWMRHQTTGYDSLVIPKTKGKRREVRKQLAHRSRSLLARYRSGAPIAKDCPLAAALQPPAVPTSKKSP